MSQKQERLLCVISIKTHISIGYGVNAFVFAQQIKQLLSLPENSSFVLTTCVLQILT